ncbi:GLUG motif-containing protein [Asticcacaulis sp. EMRT-3]|uniref:GLUG motif-containing protein n=1 Tax=Asticcacaulis sp. EMRT-3 TaxID=3040349 RepID=UPI0024AFE92D|nr:GLUG motif-containing protein [Asticcacaulis sp. EMRT-3]MDI7776390.1 GLUG motif-containing protein [Asticcacaulis sp. EMRT-3]
MYSLSDLASQDGTGYYAIAQPIDATGTTYNDYVLFNLTGTLAGLGNTISNLTISNSNNYYGGEMGLFGYMTGTVRDLGLVNASLTLDLGDNGFCDIECGELGLLAGYNGGLISHVYTTGSVTFVMGQNSDFFGGDTYAGGLAGENFGTISNSYSTASVTSPGTAGGLVGINYATIYASYATGDVSGDVGDSNNYDWGYTGGLIGDNAGPVSNVYATGAVTGYNAGGLAGYNAAAIDSAYATGLVTLLPTTSTQYAGGLVGYIAGGTITNGYYDAETTGMSDSNGGSQGVTTAYLHLTGRFR